MVFKPLAGIGNDCLKPGLIEWHRAARYGHAELMLCYLYPGLGRALLGPPLSVEHIGAGHLMLARAH